MAGYITDSGHTYVQQCSVVDGAVKCSPMEPVSETWQQQKEALDDLIEEYRLQLARLKVISEIVPR